MYWTNNMAKTPIYDDKVDTKYLDVSKKDSMYNSIDQKYLDVSKKDSMYDSIEQKYVDVSMDELPYNNLSFTTDGPELPPKNDTSYIEIEDNSPELPPKKYNLQF